MKMKSEWFQVKITTKQINKNTNVTKQHIDKKNFNTGLKILHDNFKKKFLNNINMSRKYECIN